MKKHSNIRKTANRTAGFVNDKLNTGNVAGVIGMGLMGTSITACLLMAGHRLYCVESNPVKLQTAHHRLLQLLRCSCTGAGHFAVI